jgi:hypothetical protein
MVENHMRDTVFVLVFGAFVWAAVIVGFVSLYIYAGDSLLCGALNDQDACVRLKWRHGSPLVNTYGALEMDYPGSYKAWGAL